MIKSERIFVARFLVWVFLVNALWPTLLASASEKNASLLLICSSHGYQYVWVGEDGSASDKEGNIASPCPYCVVQDDKVWSPIGFSPVLEVSSLVEPVFFDRSREPSIRYILQRYGSRAPPYVSFS